MKRVLFWTMVGIFLFFFLFVDAASGDDGLIKKLGDDNFWTREKAQEELLKKMDLNFYFYIRDLKTDDLEIQTRLKKIARCYWRKLQNDYEANVKNYPGYPWIDVLPKNYGGDERQRDNVISYYLALANGSGAPRDGRPAWTNYRVATKMWVEERIGKELEEALLPSKNESEFRAKMDLFMNQLHKDLQAMIESEDAYWNGKEKNPFRKKKQP